MSQSDTSPIAISNRALFGAYVLSGYAYTAYCQIKPNGGGAIQDFTSSIGSANAASANTKGGAGELTSSVDSDLRIQHYDYTDNTGSSVKISLKGYYLNIR